jgi:hypothetical protein
MVGRTSGWLALVLSLALVLATAELHAQPPTTVQLPTISVFSVQTSVWAPDRGAALLGGMGTAGDQRRVLGPGPALTRDTSSTRAAGGASVHVTIIDHTAIDQALLAQAAQQSGSPSATNRELDAQARWLTRHLGRADTLAGGPRSVAEAHAAHAQQQQAIDRQAADYLAAGERALAAGNPGAARVYFQMASRSSSPLISEKAKRVFESIYDKPGRVAGSIR